MNKLMVFDFDDTIFFSNSYSENKMFGFLEKVRKKYDICISTNRSKTELFDTIQECQLTKVIDYFIFNGGNYLYNSGLEKICYIEKQFVLKFNDTFKFKNILYQYEDKYYTFDFLKADMINKISRIVCYTNKIDMQRVVCSVCIDGMGLNIIELKHGYKVAIMPENITKIYYIDNLLRHQYSEVIAIGDSISDSSFLFSKNIKGFLLCDLFDDYKKSLDETEKIVKNICKELE